MNRHGDMEYLVDCSTHEISNVRRGEKFHISKQPCIIIFVCYVDILLTRG